MIIKTFRAETSSAALKRVREEMGGDAIVLKTTQETGSLGRIIYEVTACLENPTVGQTTKIFPDEAKPSTQKVTPQAKTPAPTTPVETTPIKKVTVKKEADDVWQKRYEKLELKINNFLDNGNTSVETEVNQFQEVEDQLHAHDFCEQLITEFISELNESYDGSEELIIFAKIQLVAKILQLTADGITLQEGDKLAVVGPAGSGKSSVMGKLAATLVLREKKKVTLLTLDDVKMGAIDEIAAYAEILGADYADNRTAMESSQNKDTVTLIDTVATPHIVENIVPINDKLDAIGTSYRIAVFSAIMRSKDVIAMTEQMNAINPTHLAITKTDLSTCVGTLITAAYAFGLKILYTTDSQGGVGMLHAPQVDQIVNQVLQVEVASE